MENKLSLYFQCGVARLAAHTVPAGQESGLSKGTSVGREGEGKG